MKKYIPILLLSLVLGACAPKENPDQAFSQEKTRFASELKAFTAKMMAASPEEQKSMMKDMPDREAYRDTLLYFAQTYPQKEFAADAWVEIFKLESMNRKDSLYKIALRELSDTYAKSKHLANIDPLYLSSSRTKEIGEFMQEILKQTEVKEVKGVFSMGYADWITHEEQAPQYDLEKGLAILDDILADYADVQYLMGPEMIPSLIGDKAEDAKRRLTQLAVGQLAPEIISEDLAGNKVRLSEHKGKVLMLDIWATWCGPCIKMLPDAAKMVKRLENEPFELISISIDKKVETVEKFQKKHPMPWTNWFNGDQGGILSQWNINRYPTIILVDKEGVIRERINGAAEKEKLNSSIDQLLES